MPRQWQIECSTGTCRRCIQRVQRGTDRQTDRRTGGQRDEQIAASFNPYVVIGGGILPPRRTFYAVALKPLRIVTKDFVTFHEYM